jgi:hypothetical protein
MGWDREAKDTAIAVPDREETTPQLGHPVVSRVQHLPGQVVARAVAAVDGMGHSVEEAEPFLLAAIGDAVDILQHEHRRPQFLHHSHKLGQGDGSRVT